MDLRTWLGGGSVHQSDVQNFPVIDEINIYVHSSLSNLGCCHSSWLAVKAAVIATSVPRKAAVSSAFCLQDFWCSEAGVQQIRRVL